MSSFFRFILGAALAFSAMPVFAQQDPAQEAAEQAARAKSNGEMGHEMGTTETGVTEPVPLKKQPEVSLEEATKAASATNAPAAETNVPPAETTAPAAETVAPAADTNVPAAQTAAPAVGGPAISSLTIKGDADVLDLTDLRKDLDADTIGKSLTDDQIRGVAQKYQDALIKKGYYIARVWAPATPVADGVLTLMVDEGRIGKLSLYKRKGDQTVPYEGRWYSQQQLERKLASLKEGEPFNYSQLYGTVYSFNSHPDLTADVDLTVRKVGEGDDQRRYVDMDFEVKEGRPLHAVLEFNNNGTDVTEEWRAGLTLQYLNLTKHDDPLTFSFPVSLDLSTIRSAAMSYYRPYNWRKGGSFSAFGGMSQLDTQDVVPGIDLKGNGWFAGFQGSYNFISDDRRLLNVSLGLTHSTIEDELTVGDAPDKETSTTAVTPLVLAFNYATLQPNKRGARSQVTLATEINRGGFLGASDDEELQSQRENAVADFFVEKLQYARVQPVRRNKEDPRKDWILYTRVTGQYASDPLIPGEQLGAGGANTVRGYLENEVLADDGLIGNVELRTPIRHYSKIPRWLGKPLDDKKYADYEGLQFVFFVDGGYLTLKDAVEGSDDSFSLLSVGPGLRYTIGNGFQARVDWGFPLATTDDSDTSGRGHFSLQFTF